MTMADTAGGTSVGEIFLALGISPESISKMLETIRSATAQATTGSPVTINMNVNAGQVKKQVEQVVAAVAETAKPVEVPVVVQTADALFKMYKLNKEIQDFETQRPDLKIEVDATTAEAGIRTVTAATQNAAVTQLAFGHDFTHTMELIGGAAQRLRGGLAEISGYLKGVADEAKAGAQTEEVSFARMKNVLGETDERAKGFVETTAALRKNLTAAQIADATTSFFQFGKSLGYTNEEAIVSSEKFVTLAADLAKVNAKPFEETLGALRTQLLRGGNGAAEYGIRIKEVDIQHEAARINVQGLTDGFTQEELALARTNLIMKQAGDVHERAAAAQTTLATRQGVLKTQTEELLVQVGKYAIEMAGPFVEGMISAVGWLRKFSDTHPTLTKGFVVVAGAVSALITALTGLAIVTEIAVSVKTGIAGIATILGVQTAATGAASAAALAHAGAATVDTTAVAAEAGATQWAAFESHLHTEAMWENAIAANGDAVAQQRLAASASEVAVAETAAAGATGTATASTGILATGVGGLATVLGTMLGVLELGLGAIAGIGAGAIAAAAGLVLLAAAVGALIGYGLYKLVDWAFPGLIKGMEKSAEKAEALKGANERLAKSGATAADAADVQAESIRKLVEAKKLDASWTEILTKEATADIALLKKHSESLDVAAERVKNYNRYMAEGFTTNEAFAQSVSKLARLSALRFVANNKPEDLTASQKKEMADILASLTDEDKVRAGIIKKQDYQVDREENVKKLLEQQKKISEELASIQKARWELQASGAEAEARSTKNLEDRLQLEKNVLYDKGQSEKQDAHEKLGLKGPSPARDQVDSEIDAKTAQAVANLEKESARQIAEVKLQFQEKIRAEQRKTADEAIHAEAEVAIAQLATTDQYSSKLAQVQLQQNETHLAAMAAYNEEYKALQLRGATQDEFQALLKSFQNEEQSRVRKFAAERQKLAIEEAKKKEDAYKSSDKAALDAELALEEARAKGMESLDAELVVLKKREAEEVKQATERGAEQRELANLKRKFAAEQLRLIEDNARAADKAAKKASEDGRKALNEALENDAIAKDKREGRVSQAAYKETEKKLEGGLGNVHTQEDANKFKEHTKNALEETFSEQQKNVKKLQEEADKAVEAQEKTKGKKNTPEERSKVQADVTDKVQKAAAAQKEFAKATADAADAQKRLDAKADIAAKNAEVEEKARKRLVDRAKEEAANPDAKKDDPNAPAGAAGAKPDKDANPVQKALEAATGGLKDLPAVAQGLLKATADLLDASKVLPQVANALNGLVAGQSAFFQGLTEFGTSVVEKISKQQGQLKDLAAQVAANKKSLDDMDKNDPNNNDNTAAGLGGD